MKYLVPKNALDLVKGQVTVLKRVQDRSDSQSRRRIRAMRHQRVAAFEIGGVNRLRRVANGVQHLVKISHSSAFQMKKGR